MPWRTLTTVSDRRRSFLADHDAGVPLSTLLVAYGIKKSAAYALLQRAREVGVDEAVVERSRAPHHRPTALDSIVIERVLQLRRAFPRWGAKKLAKLYIDEFGAGPSAASVGNILSNAGMVAPRRRRRAPRPTVPLAAADEPNDVWAVDHKGRMSKLGVEPLTVLDVKSRFWVGCAPLVSKSEKETRGVFEQLFDTYGTPRVIRVDGGAPWASAFSPLRLTRLSAWWLALGVGFEVVASCQENGHVERLHGTMEREMDAADVVDIRDHFDFHRHLYNDVRPHESLGMETPSSRYVPSPRRACERTFDPAAARCDEVRAVNNDGTIWWKGSLTFISEALVGRRVGLRQLSPTTWSVHFHEFTLGNLTASGFEVLR
jgi:transposase InsO family protein